MLVSVVIPVLNGERYLDEVLTAINAQIVDAEVEVLVIDSGSSDRSMQIARSHGARTIEIEQSEFGHGRTRNFGVMQTEGELIAFLTQDATPASEQWLAAYLDAVALSPDVAAAYGPHLPREDTSPLMAQMLTNFFHDFSPSGEAVLQRPGDLGYLSNSNSCIARSAWQEIPFRDIPYAEDQAMGADLLGSGYSKVYQPRAAVLHAHDYSLVEGFRRYFDEYRGLRDSVDQKTEGTPISVLDIIRRSVVADRAWLAEHEPRPAVRARWTAQSVVHHTGRVFFGGLGERAPKLPAWLREAISLEGRDDGVIERVRASRSAERAFAPSSPDQPDAGCEVLRSAENPTGSSAGSEDFRALPMPRRKDLLICRLPEGSAGDQRQRVLQALAEVHQREPRLRILLYGSDEAVAAPFDHEVLGVADHGRLARLYNEASVGLVGDAASDNRAVAEMLACGLPVVALGKASPVAAFEAVFSVVELPSGP